MMTAADKKSYLGRTKAEEDEWMNDGSDGVPGWLDGLYISCRIFLTFRALSCWTSMCMSLISHKVTELVA